MTDSRSIHLITNNSISFLFMAEQYSIVYVCHIFLIQSFVDGHLGCFHVLAIVNSAAMNTGVHVSFQISVFVFSGYMPRSGIAGSHGRVVSSDLTGACCVFLACQDGTWSEAPDSSFCFLLPKF